MNDTKTVVIPGLRRAIAGVVDGRRGLDAAEKRQLISALVVEVTALLADLSAQVERQRPIIEAAEALRGDVGDLPWVPGTPLARLVDALAAARRAAPVGPAGDDEPNRCPSCEHSWEYHSDPGCWHAVTVGRRDKAMNCPCGITGRADLPRRSGTTDETGHQA